MNFIEEKLENIEFEHRVWMNQLSFSWNEIALYETRLKKLISQLKASEKQTLAQSMLQAILIMKGQVNLLKNQISEHITTTQNKIQSNGALEALVNSTHHKTKIQLNIFTQNYQNLKNRFEENFVFQN